MARQYILFFLITTLQHFLLSDAEQYICDDANFNFNLTGRCELGPSACSKVCNNGYCDGFDCKCDEGYEMVENKCESLCKKPCPALAKCTSRDNCTCAAGLALDGDACLPICAPECGTNEYCVAPSICRCLPGYQNIDGVCKSKCEPACGAHAICVGTNQCRCDDGSVNQTCRCKEGFDNIVENNACAPETDCPGIFHVYFISLLAVLVLLICITGFSIMLYCINRKQQPTLNHLELEHRPETPKDPPEQPNVYGNTLQAGKIL